MNGTNLISSPPPPPPAPLGPLYRNTNTQSIVSGVSQTSGVIEIVMDDDEDKIEIPAAPQQPFARSGSISHSRGRSENDSSLSGRFSRAAERLRSASRGRNGSPLLDRTKTPQEHSPYESIPPVWSPTRSTTNVSVPVTERHPREVKAAMEGGMI